MKIVKADEEGLRIAAATMRNGGVVIYPTETVYGIGCIPSDPDATMRVCEIKGRAENPLPLVCSDIEMARKVVQFNATAEKLAEAFWPGPLMFILPSKVVYPMWVTHGKKTLGLRVPGAEVPRKLAQLAGGVMVSTSANISGELPAITAKEANSQTGFKVDVVVDGGPSPVGTPSTILDLSSKEMWILRSGPITGSQIMEALKR
jgi:L-threonylcarbamoyladenylate synthase